MLENITDIVKKLKKGADKQEKEVLKEYNKAIESSKYTLARLISDELVDYSETCLSKERTELYKELYNYTMLIYEINA